MAASSPLMVDVEACLLAHLSANAEILDSRSFASSLGVPHKEVEDVIKSLSAFRVIESAVGTYSPASPPQSPNLTKPPMSSFASLQDITRETWVLTDEAKGYAARGSPEAQLVSAIPPEGASKGTLKEKLGDIFDIGMKVAAKNKWVGFEKGNKELVLRKIEETKDELQEQLKRLENGEVIADKVIDDLKRRKLVTKDYHEGLKKWVEIGNSGMFRPEMLLPMGLPEGVNVIAWGLSLERPTMILYGIDNIWDLFGPKVDFNLIKSSPICRLGL
ncbi:hypothetical protein ACQ4PT_016817 [Festuca glaucescens]